MINGTSFSAGASTLVRCASRSHTMTFVRNQRGRRSGRSRNRSLSSNYNTMLRSLNWSRPRRMRPGQGPCLSGDHCPRILLPERHQHHLLHLYPHPHLYLSRYQTMQRSRPLEAIKTRKLRTSKGNLLCSNSSITMCRLRYRSRVATSSRHRQTSTSAGNRT